MKGKSLVLWLVMVVALLIFVPSTAMAQGVEGDLSANEKTNEVSQSNQDNSKAMPDHSGLAREAVPNHTAELPPVQPSDPDKENKSEAVSSNLQQAKQENVADGSNNDEYPYIGYQDDYGAGNIGLYVKKKGEEKARVVYCFNKSLHWPEREPEVKGLAYKKTTGSADAFKNQVNENSPYKGEDLINRLKFVLLNGYPNSRSIQNSLGLTDDAMRKVTQWAVWHFTDNQYTDLKVIQSAEDKEVLALGILLSKAGSKTLNQKSFKERLKEYQASHPGYEIPKAMVMPEKATLDLYIHNNYQHPDGKHYQNLLSAYLINEDDNKIIDIPKEPPSVENKYKITIAKQGADGGPLAGAQLEILAENAKEPLVEWVSGIDYKELELAEGSYILNEIKAPEGYQRIKNIKFKITAKGEIEVTDTGLNEDGRRVEGQTYNFNDKLIIVDQVKSKDTKTHVIIRKYEKGLYTQLLAGAKLALYKVDSGQETLVENGEFTSDAEGKEFELADGQYVLKEIQAPSGYKTTEAVTFEVTKGKVTVNGKDVAKGIRQPFSYEAYSDFNDAGEMVAGNPYGKFYYVKTTEGNKVVYCFNSTKHAPVESEDGGENINYNPFDGGDIRYNKIINPDNLYKYAANPRIQSSELATKVTRIIYAGYPNNKAGVDTSGLTETQLRAGTQLAVYYYTDSADLTDQGLKKLGDGFQKLIGESDAQKKIKAYAQSLINYSNSDQAPADLTYDFYVSNHGGYQNLIGTTHNAEDLYSIVVMEDEKEKPDEPEKPKEAKIFFSKRDILGKELPGAQLQIKDKTSGKLVKEWTSGETPKTFALQPGQYEFIETAAPEGYKIATTINFEVSQEGVITADKDSLKTVGSANILVMVDDYKKTPSKPNEPSTPSRPSKPSKPSKPSEPSTPSQPQNPSNITIKVSKEWLGADGEKIKAPVDQVEVELFKDGQATGKKVLLNSANHWTQTFEGLQEKAESNRVNYSVKEVGETAGTVNLSGKTFKVLYAGNIGDGLIISNQEISKKHADKTGDKANKKTETTGGSSGQTDVKKSQPPSSSLPVTRGIKPVPKTGVGSNRSTYALSLAAFGAMILLAGIRRRKEKQ